MPVETGVWAAVGATALVGGLLALRGLRGADGGNGGGGGGGGIISSDAAVQAAQGALEALDPGVATVVKIAGTPQLSDDSWWVSSSVETESGAFVSWDLNNDGQVIFRNFIPITVQVDAFTGDVVHLWRDNLAPL